MTSIAVFEDRLILEAQPPITDAQLAEVERRIGAPLPAGLAALWRSAFGGALNYALEVAFGGHVARFSFTELFYPDSDGYRDLWGWIEHEEELAAESGEALRFLPFGGFEYLDRLYVCLEPGPDHGAVFAWMQGLPPAWALRLHDDAVARIADDVPALFRLLALESDPFGADGDDAAPELAAAIEEVEADDPARAAELRIVARRALLDWRGALEGSTLADNARLRRLALVEAGRNGDLALVDRLAAAGCDLDERYLGGGNLLDHMLLHGHDAAAGALIERGVDPSNAVLAAPGTIDAARAAQLIALGAKVSGVAAYSAAMQGHLDVARRIVDALEARALAPLMADLERFAASAETTAQRIEQRKMGSNLPPAHFREQAADLRTLRGEVAARLER